MNSSRRSILRSPTWIAALSVGTALFGALVFANVVQFESSLRTIRAYRDALSRNSANPHGTSRVVRVTLNSRWLSCDSVHLRTLIVSDVEPFRCDRSWGGRSDRTPGS